MAKKRKQAKSKKSKKERKIEKEILWIVGFAIFLVLLFIASTSIFKQLNKIEYEGLIFTREKFGNIPVYHYTYYFTDNSKLFKYNLFVRNNPKTNDVPVEGGDISFEGNKFTYISLDANGLDQCNQSVLAVADLSTFLTQNRLTVKSGTLNAEEANETGQPFVTCENKPDRPVITIREGEETKINVNDLCYEISVANCEILKATEKFKIQSVIDAKNNK